MLLALRETGICIAAGEIIFRGERESLLRFE